MCTAATYKTKDSYIGRTLDYEFSYGDEVVITPRQYKFQYRHMDMVQSAHFAIIGMAYVCDDYPLYYDAINEEGLGMAGLNFVGNAFYPPLCKDKDNIAQFEFIPWILSQCSSVFEAENLLKRMNLVATPFNNQLPTAQLHWLIADASRAITVEFMKNGLHIYENPIGILTNNPPFDTQMFLLNNYMALSTNNPTNHFSKNLDLKCYSRGMGAMGLPGDLSSASRFARASFTKMNSVSEESEEASVSQFFHILGSVDQPRGCCEVEPGKYEVTIYTSCCNMARGIYYYTAYDNHQICAVDMHRVNLNETQLFRYPARKEEQIFFQN